MSDQPASASASQTVQVDGAPFRIVAVPVGKSSFREMMQSKKFLAMLAGLIFTVLGKVGFEVSDAMQEQILNLVMVYIGAQGVADAGQGFAKVKSQANPPAAT